MPWYFLPRIKSHFRKPSESWYLWTSPNHIFTLDWELNEFIAYSEPEFNKDESDVKKSSNWKSLFWRLNKFMLVIKFMLAIWSILVNVLLVKINWSLNSDCLQHRNLNISASWFWSNMDMRAGRSWELEIRISAHSFVRHDRCTWKTRVKTRKCKCSIGGLL